ncbi:MAG: SURF1 family protein [Acidimicrobiia bacterium]|nr:SURF1 family protein [Acidimicrobiia bacterium]
MTNRDYSFVRRPKWIAGHIIVLVAIVVFVNLGFWQLRRHAERVEFNQLLVDRSTEAEIPLAEALERYGPAQDSLELRAVSVTGTYAAQEEVILLARSFEGISGHQVLTPLYLEDGRAVIVDRGWVPIDLDEPGLEVFAPPQGEVDLGGILRKTEVRASFGPTIPAEGVVTRVPRVDLERLNDQVAGELAPVYLQLLEQDPAQSGELPRLVPLPEPTEGPHRGYAVQWFLFGAVTAVGYPILLRRTAERHQSDGP